MDGLIYAGLFGLIGGLTRAFVGLFKYYFPLEKNRKAKKHFQPLMLLFTLVAAGVIGVFSGLLLNADYRLNLLAGYAGTDFIESVFKVRRKTEVRI